MKKKNIIIVFIITIIVIGLLIGGFFLAKNKLKPTKQETEKNAELKQAGSFIRSKYVNGNNTYECYNCSYTIKFDVKGAVPSTTESGKYDYYGQMSITMPSIFNYYRPIDYTWKLYTSTSSTETPSSSSAGNIFVYRNNCWSGYDYLIIKYYPKSAAKVELKPTTVIFKYNSNKELYELVEEKYQIPFPQWQVLKYEGETTQYYSDNGVVTKFDTYNSGASGDYIIYNSLPDDAQYDGLLEKHIITFTSTGIKLDNENQNDKYKDYPIREKGNLVISP